MSFAGMVSSVLSRRISVVLAVLAMAVWMGMAVLDRKSAYDYISADQGHYLFGAQRILSGEVPYRDFFWHYGPLPLYSLAAVVALAGATPMAFEIHQSIWNLGAALICLFAMRKWFGPAVGLAVFLLTSFGWLASLGFIYAPVEKVALLTLAVLWRDPAQRTRRHNLTIGAVLGLMQGIKFGTAFVAGAAWLIIDFLALRATASGSFPARRWIGDALWIGFGFAVIQVGWLVGGVLVLGDAAGNFLWPTFHLEWYQSYVTAENRWFQFHNLGYFLGVQLPFLACLVVTCVMLVQAFRGPGAFQSQAVDGVGEMVRRLPALLLPLVYWIGCAVIIKHVYNLIAYMWLLCPVVGLGLAHRSRVVTAALVLALLPSASLIPREAMRRARTNDDALALYDTQRGSRLWLRADELPVAEEFGRQIRDHAEMNNAPGIIVGPKEKLGVHIGSGLYAAFRLRPAIHNPWLFAGATQVAGGEAEFARYRGARWLSVKLPASLALASPEEQREYVAVHALPFDVARNYRILDAFEAPMRYGEGWLYYGAAQ